MQLKHLVRICAILLICTLPCKADQPHKFYDRPAKIELASWALVGGADLGQTCHVLANGGREDWFPPQSCKGLVGFSAVAVVAVEGISYMFHRKGHHKLERLSRIIAICTNAAGITYSYRNGAFR